MLRFSLLGLHAASLVAGLCLAGAAHAQEPPPAPPVARDPAAAEALFRAGLKAMDEGDWDTACPKFEASGRLDPSAGTSINVARCLEHRGKTAQAWAELGRARTLAREASDVRRRELEGFVDREIARVEAILPRLRILAKELPAGAEITRDGIAQAPGVVGEALPVDPGEHVIEVRAPGRAVATWKVQAVAGAIAEIAVEAGAPQTPAPPPGDAPTTREGTHRGNDNVALMGIVLTGVGVAGLAVGLITGLNAIAAKDDIVALGCNDDAGTCPDVEAQRRADDYASRGSDLAAVSTTAFIAGSLLVVSGATILVANAILEKDGGAPPQSAKVARSSPVRIAPSVSPDARGAWGGGVWVSGGF